MSSFVVNLCLIARMPLLNYAVHLISWLLDVRIIQTKCDSGELTCSEKQQCLPGHVVPAKDVRTVCACVMIEIGEKQITQLSLCTAKSAVA